LRNDRECKVVDPFNCLQQNWPHRGIQRINWPANNEHTLIPVTATMIHSAVWDSERFVLKDGRRLHMVMVVGAVGNFRVNIKHVQIDGDDGTGLVRVTVWKEQKECMAQHQIIHECSSNYIFM
jgi:hypothetical protein